MSGPPPVSDVLPRQEAAAVRHLHALAREDEPMPRIEADAVVRSLYVTTHGHNRLRLVLCRPIRPEDRLLTRAMNVTVLSMALAEELGLSPAEVRSIGLSGLLHDIGMALVPAAVLAKDGELAEEERASMERHASEGARLLVASGSHFDLAAAVAYEHHLQEGERSYPALRFPRESHFASRLVRICDVFDALCAPRPDRAGRDTEHALELLKGDASLMLDPPLTRTFIELIRRTAVDGRLYWVELDA